MATRNRANRNRINIATIECPTGQTLRGLILIIRVTHGKITLFSFRKRATYTPCPFCLASCPPGPRKLAAVTIPFLLSYSLSVSSLSSSVFLPLHSAASFFLSLKPARSLSTCDPKNFSLPHPFAKSSPCVYTASKFHTAYICSHRPMRLRMHFCTFSMRDVRRMVCKNPRT